MEFPLKNEFDGKKELLDLDNPNLRLLNYKGIQNTNAEKWDDFSLEKTNQLKYFSGNWEKCTAENAANFSAIAYYFAKALSDSLNVPVGIIEIAVGGAPLEAFIDRKTLEFNPNLVDVLYRWKENDFIMPWCRERATQNLANSDNPMQRHPFEPAYIFEAGISNLTKFPFQGVIWYQGESNAHNIEHFKIVFPQLVTSWRNAFGNSDLPFYFAQLSSLDRPSWPEFRDCQRQLALQIENSGMVVTSDFGDSLNVHPIHKKEIGLRFAKLALNKTYNFALVCSGPEVDFAVQNKNQVEIYFKNAPQLKTVNNSTINELEVAGNDRIFKSVKGRIEGNKIIIQAYNNELLQIRYSWKPFSRGNLINETGFPASTFIINIQNNIEHGKN
jgi:sialate O-acetylesterase